MSIPVSQPLPPPPGSGPRIRGRRPSARALAGQAGLVAELAEGAALRPDMLLLSLLSALIFCAALLADAPALALLALVCLPFQGGLFRAALSPAAGSPLLLLGGLVWLAGSFLAWLFAGALAGTLLGRFGLPDPVLLPAFFQPGWPWLLLAAFGALWGALRQVRYPRLRPRTGSLAAGAAFHPFFALAGMALSRGDSVAFQAALQGGLLLLFVAIAVAALAYALAGLSPAGGSGVITGAVLLGLGLLSAWFILRAPAPPAELTLPPPATASPVPQATHTAAPSASPPPTATLEPSAPDRVTPTPRPSPTQPPLPSATPELAQAIVNAEEGGGAFLRSWAGFDSPALTAVSNGLVVELLPERETVDGTEWVRIRLQSGQEGWMAARYLSPR